MYPCLIRFCCILVVLLGVSDAWAEETSARVRDGLLVLYDFAEPSGAIVRDRAGTREPLDLRIEDPSAVLREPGALVIRERALIRSVKPPRRIVSMIKKSRAATIEAWLQPRSTTLKGPARIVTFSKDSTNRNFTLGQDGSRYDVRFRTQKTNSNGLPSLVSTSDGVQKKLTHLVYTRRPSGETQLWIDGQLNAESKIAGNLGNWDATMRLALGDELNTSRAWRGTYHLVAIYGRALSAEEIQQNFSAGASARIPHLAAQPAVDPRAAHFELEVAPILANQCLECHDSLHHEGGLDLSKRTSALAGGDSGEVIIAKNSAESLLWQSVEADEMPHERKPLTNRQKQTLKKWIDDGAVWSLATIDPAIYVHGGRPDANWLRRLTVSEYIETVRDLFDIDISQEARQLLPPDARADGFSNTAYNLTVDLKHVQAYQQLAEIIVERIDVEAFCKQFVQRVAFSDKGMKDLIRNMGRRIFRGPLEDHEITTLHGIYTTIAATDDGTAIEVAGLLIEAMLQSPRFLYRVERQRGDGMAEPVGDYELASRMSYMIWGGPPDESLSRAADDGELFDIDVIRQHALRMLKDPRAIKQSERFFVEWLQLDRLRNLQPNPKKFPSWDPALANDMRNETLAFVRDVVWNQNRPLCELLNAQVTFVTPRLAKHYGLPPQAADVAGSQGELVRFALKDVPSRGGLLTQGSLLTIGGDEASMVTRGLLVMHELLRGVVKDPPPCVDTTPVPTKPGLSQRAIAEERIRDETCGGCHGRFEPLAFGLERFDGLGGYHEQDEHDNTLREDGEIIFPGAVEKVRYNTASELMDLMAQSQRVQESITWKLTQYALGRPLTAADAKSVQAIHAAAMKSGGTYADTMIAIITSDLVTMTQTDRME